MSDLPEPIPAATLVLMRPGSEAPELLFIERAKTMAFAAGALVFPGGRIDEDDHLLAARIGIGLDDAAARIAAIRETIEETGIAPALAGPAEPVPTAHHAGGGARDPQSAREGRRRSSSERGPHARRARARSR